MSEQHECPLMKQARTTVGIKYDARNETWWLDLCDEYDGWFNVVYCPFCGVKLEASE